MSSALDRIAALHTTQGEAWDFECDECSHPWPCPTRRLCDEGADERRAEEELIAAIFSRREADTTITQVALGGAEMLAAIDRQIAAHKRERAAIDAALAAHDAARMKEGL